MNEKQLLDRFGLTDAQIEDDVARLEDENADQGVIGPVYYDLHMRPHTNEKMVTISLRMPKSLVDKADKEANKYHISRSEYLRRQLSHS